MPRYLLPAALLIALGVSTAKAQPSADCGSVQVISSALSAKDAAAYCRYAAAERAKVETFWGPTWQAPIRIHVDQSFVISKALLPAFRGNRGYMEMPLRRVRNNDGALLHELVHIYAPHGNRFLAEGLAVYLQAKIGGNPSIPNFGQDLASLARKRLTDSPSLAKLNAVRTPAPLSTVMDEMTAYILAGSFVAFLIERYALPSFRTLYETDSYEQAYAKGLAALEQEWRAALQAH